MTGQIRAMGCTVLKYLLPVVPLSTMIRRAMDGLQVMPLEFFRGPGQSYAFVLLIFICGMLRKLAMMVMEGTLLGMPC